MKQYHKIHNVFKRNLETNKLIEGDWARQEFGLLKDIDWVCTEKIDGTNIRVIWNGSQVEFKGKTDKAEIPKHLLETLQDIFTDDKMEEFFPDSNNVCLYGEGYGKKIQKGGNYISDRVNFILFDVKIGEWWLTREVNEQIAEKLNIDIVPIIGVWKLEKAIEYTKKGFKSTIAENKDYMAEGIIAKPKYELFDRRGDRIITKIKHLDLNK